MSAAPVLSIDTETAEAITHSCTAMQEVEKHRWYTRQLVVFTRDALVAEVNAASPEGDAETTVPQHDHFCFYYREPASELQEDQDRYDSDPVEVFAALATITSTIAWSTEVVE
jgi:hypothetical protein